MQITQDRLPYAADFCTTAWAAEHLGVSMRSVGRYVAAGLLADFTPLVGSRESKRKHRILSTVQVRSFRDARELVGRAVSDA